MTAEYTFGLTGLTNNTISTASKFYVSRGILNEKIWFYEKS